MAIFQRWFGGTRRAASVVTQPMTTAQPPAPVLLPGGEDLEVVGESNYQGALWQVVGVRTRDRVRFSIHAVLIPETDNPYDPNAISVWISGSRVGYLSRADAADYRSGLLALEARHGRHMRSVAWLSAVGLDRTDRACSASGCLTTHKTSAWCRSWRPSRFCS